MISPQDFQKLKYDTLKYFWGYTDFRDSQEEIINAVINEKDTLVLLPTGAGKSLCYQLPALLKEGTCLVVSPLLALMKDQVNQLKSRGIEAEYLSSELDEYDAETIYDRCKEGLTKLLYVSPERLTNKQFIQNMEEIQPLSGFDLLYESTEIAQSRLVRTLSEFIQGIEFISIPLRKALPSHIKTRKIFLSDRFRRDCVREYDGQIGKEGVVLK